MAGQRWLAPDEELDDDSAEVIVLRPLDAEQEEEFDEAMALAGYEPVDDEGMDDEDLDDFVEPVYDEDEEDEEEEEEDAGEERSLLSVPEVAEIACVTEVTVRNLIADGALDSEVVGGRYILRAEEVFDFFEGE